MNILLLTAFDDSMEPVARLSIPTMQRYASRYGCAFRAVEGNSGDRPGAWLKIPAIREALAENFDFVWWLDADALVVRSDVDIRSAIDPNANLQLAWHGPTATTWTNSDHPPHFNTGSMLIRAGTWSQDFFARLWQIGQIDHVWKDQATLLHMLGYDDILGLGPENPAAADRAHVARLDPIWNAIPGLAAAADSIIHHYAGIDNDVRLPLMEFDLKTLSHRENAAATARSALAGAIDEYATLIRRTVRERNGLRHHLDLLRMEKDEMARTNAAELALAKSELVEAQSMLARTESELAQAQSNLARTESELAQAQNNLARTETELAQAQSNLARTQTELTQARDNLARTEKETALASANSQRLAAEVAAIYNSRSWRITKPLRMARAAMQRG
jgi:hypothetical protein